MGLAIGIAAAVVAIASAAAAAYAQSQAGQTQAKVAQFGARQAENQALAARQAAAVKERQERERLNRVQATARARALASGVIATEGSPLLVMMENARQAELEAQLVRFGGEIQAQGLEQESKLRTFQGRAAKRAANIGAGTTLLSGIASAAGIVAGRGSTGTTAGTSPGFGRQVG